MRRLTVGHSAEVRCRIFSRPPCWQRRSGSPIAAVANNIRIALLRRAGQRGPVGIRNGHRVAATTVTVGVNGPERIVLASDHVVRKTGRGQNDVGQAIDVRCRPTRGGVRTDPDGEVVIGATQVEKILACLRRKYVTLVVDTPVLSREQDWIIVDVHVVVGVGLERETTDGRCNACKCGHHFGHLRDVMC